MTFEQRQQIRQARSDDIVAKIRRAHGYCASGQCERTPAKGQTFCYWHREKVGV